MKIAIITAMAEEAFPIYKKYDSIVTSYTQSGVLIRQIETEQHTLYLAKCGIGEIRAALAVQLLADKFNIDVVLNFGFVGAINNALNIGELVIAEKVCHHQFDITAVNNTTMGQYDDKKSVYFDLDSALISKINAELDAPLRLVKVASGDKFIGRTADKDFLRRVFEADVCEMELAALAIACERNNIPLFSMKVVSDKADNSAVVTFAQVLADGLTEYERYLPAIFDALAK